MYIILIFMICIRFSYMKPKGREEMIRKLYIDGGKNEDMENKTGIL